MKKIKMKLLVFCLVFSAQADMLLKGGHSGNGGGAHYCTYNQTLPRWEFYDLWEGKNPLDPRNTKPLDIAPYDGISSKQEYLDRAIKKVAAIKPRLAAALKRALVIYNKGVQNRDNLVVEDDAHLFFVAKGCAYYQLVNWIDSKEALEWYGLEKEVILRDEAAYKQLNARDQAASDLHEAAYKVRRAFNLNTDESGSVYVRKFVAQVFSNTPVQNYLYDLIGPFNTPTVLQKNNLNDPKVSRKVGENFSLQYVLKKHGSQIEFNNAILEIENLNDFTLDTSSSDIGLIKAQQKASVKAYNNTYIDYNHAGFWFQLKKPCFDKDSVGFTYPFKVKLKAFVCGETIEFEELLVEESFLAPYDSCYPKNGARNAYFRLEFLSPPI